MSLRALRKATSYRESRTPKDSTNRGTTQLERENRELRAQNIAMLTRPIPAPQIPNQPMAPIIIQSPPAPMMPMMTPTFPNAPNCPVCPVCPTCPAIPDVPNISSDINAKLDEILEAVKSPPVDAKGIADMIVQALQKGDDPLQIAKIVTDAVAMQPTTERIAAEATRTILQALPADSEVTRKLDEVTRALEAIQTNMVTREAVRNIQDIFTQQFTPFSTAIEEMRGALKGVQTDDAWVTPILEAVKSALPTNALQEAIGKIGDAAVRLEAKATSMGIPEVTVTAITRGVEKLAQVETALSALRQTVSTPAAPVPPSEPDWDEVMQKMVSSLAKALQPMEAQYAKVLTDTSAKLMETLGKAASVEDVENALAKISAESQTWLSQSNALSVQAVQDAVKGLPIAQQDIAQLRAAIESLQKDMVTSTQLQPILQGLPQAIRQQTEVEAIARSVENGETQKAEILRALKERDQVVDTLVNQLAVSTTSSVKDTVSQVITDFSTTWSTKVAEMVKQLEGSVQAAETRWQNALQKVQMDVQTLSTDRVSITQKMETLAASFRDEILAKLDLGSEAQVTQLTNLIQKHGFPTDFWTTMESKVPIQTVVEVVKNSVQRMEEIVQQPVALLQEATEKLQKQLQVVTDLPIQIRRGNEEFVATIQASGLGRTQIREIVDILESEHPMKGLDKWATEFTAKYTPIADLLTKMESALSGQTAATKELGVEVQGLKTALKDANIPAAREDLARLAETLQKQYTSQWEAIQSDIRQFRVAMQASVPNSVVLPLPVGTTVTPDSGADVYALAQNPMGNYLKLLRDAADPQKKSSWDGTQLNEMYDTVRGEIVTLVETYRALWDVLALYPSLRYADAKVQLPIHEFPSKWSETREALVSWGRDASTFKAAPQLALSVDVVTRVGAAVLRVAPMFQFWRKMIETLLTGIRNSLVCLPTQPTCPSEVRQKGLLKERGTFYTYVRIRRDDAHDIDPRFHAWVSNQRLDPDQRRLVLFHSFEPYDGNPDTLLSTQNPQPPRKYWNVQDQAMGFGPFTRIFADPTISNAQIAENMSEWVTRLEKGQNVFVMAYGPSGAGKTATLLYFRDAKQEGVIPSALKKLPTTMKTCTLTSYEVMQDAPQPRSWTNILQPQGDPIEFTRGTDGSWVVSGTSTISVSKPGENTCSRPSPRSESPISVVSMGDALSTLNESRFNCHTVNNPQSSRSHLFLVFRFGSVDSWGTTPSGPTLIVADLAGREAPFPCADIRTYYDSYMGSPDYRDVAERLKERPQRTPIDDQAQTVLEHLTKIPIGNAVQKLSWPDDTKAKLREWFTDAFSTAAAVERDEIVKTAQQLRKRPQKPQDDFSNWENDKKTWNALNEESPTIGQVLQYILSADPTRQDSKSTAITWSDRKRKALSADPRGITRFVTLEAWRRKLSELRNVCQRRTAEGDFINATLDDMVSFMSIASSVQKGLPEPILFGVNQNIAGPSTLTIHPDNTAPNIFQTLLGATSPVQPTQFAEQFTTVVMLVINLSIPKPGQTRRVYLPHADLVAPVVTRLEREREKYKLMADCGMSAPTGCDPPIPMPSMEKPYAPTKDDWTNLLEWANAYVIPNGATWGNTGTLYEQQIADLQRYIDDMEIRNAPSAIGTLRFTDLIAKHTRNFDRAIIPMSDWEGVSGMPFGVDGTLYSPMHRVGSTK